MRVRFLLALALALVLQFIPMPDALAALRPMWVPLLLAFWALARPEPRGLLGAWFIGLLLDAAYGSALGQHALGLTLLVYAVLQLRTLLVVFHIWQAALALTPAWLGYSFLMFWIDGATEHSADGWQRWMPVLTTTLAWPLLAPLLRAFHRNARDD